MENIADIIHVHLAKISHVPVLCSSECDLEVYVLVRPLVEPKNLQEELLRDCGHHEVPVRRKAVKGLGRYHNDDAAIESIAKEG